MDEGEKDEIGEWDERHTLFCHSGPDASSFNEDAQAISLESCDLTLNRRKTDSQMGVVTVVTEKGESHAFSTMMVDDDMGLKQMEMLCEQLQAAIERNRDLDSPGVVKGARFAVVAFPAEESRLCDSLIYAAADDLAQAFEGELKVSICVTWSKEGLVKDNWWMKWVNMVRDAYQDGQQIVVFNRRNWTQRKEPRDVFISPDTSVDWPGRAVELGKGRPLKQHDVATQRQVAWLRKQCEDPIRRHQKIAWNPARFEFWSVDTIDALRPTPDYDGDTYEGAWSVKGSVVDGPWNCKTEKSGQGNQTFANGDVYSGGWKHGKQHGHGAMEFAETRDLYEGGWKAGKKHGHGVLSYADGDVYDGEWEDDKEHGKGKYIDGAKQRWQISLWSAGVAGKTIESGQVGEEEEEEKDREENPSEAQEAEAEETEDEDEVESTAMRLEKKKSEMRAKMEREDTGGPSALEAEEVEVEEDMPAAAETSVIAAATQPLAQDVSEIYEDEDEDDDYNTSELLEVLDEMDADELEGACKHHALLVGDGTGALTEDAMREALKAHYRDHPPSAAPTDEEEEEWEEVPEEEIRPSSPAGGAGPRSSGELQTFKSDAKVAGFKKFTERTAVKRGVEEAALGRAPF